MMSLGSIAAPDCRTGQSKGRYRARAASILPPGHDGLNSYIMLQPILGLEKGKKFGQNKGYTWFSNMVNDSAYAPSFNQNRGTSFGSTR
jgi:hypothetical protein